MILNSITHKVILFYIFEIRIVIFIYLLFYLFDVSGKKQHRRNDVHKILSGNGIVNFVV